MGDLQNFVKGTCMQMCPEEEIEMREKEELLHILEMVPGTEYKTPKADRNRIVKSYSRSAAGKKLNNEHNLRPAEVLLKTVGYLLCEVVNVTTLAWHDVYDFISDRLRSVRQDMIIQNISTAESISLLQPIVRFYAYAAYRLCNEPKNYFDATLNKNQLQENLKSLLQFYNEYDQFFEDLNSSEYYDELLIDTRPKLESLYVLLNMGDSAAIWRALNLPLQWRSELVRDAIAISLNYRYNNFVRTCRLISNLPALLAATASLHLPELRRKSFQIMSIAHNNKNFGFTLNNLKTLLLYNAKTELQCDCRHYGLCADDNCVYFTKSSCPDLKTLTIPARHERFVDDKIEQESLESLILFGN